MKKLLLFTLFSLSLVGLCFSTASAIPSLQLYGEGAAYDPITQTWMVTSNPFTLWVIGDVSATAGAIYDVQLTAAFSSNETGTISFASTTASGLPLPGDTSIPSAPVFVTSGIGTQPMRGDSTLLQKHGVFGPGTSWKQYDIGDFILMDSPVGDFINTFPSTFPDLGQINAYTVTVTGYTAVHFDAFNHTVDTAGAYDFVFAPFSHDVESSSVSEPATMLLLGSGLLGLVGFPRKKFKK